MIIRMNEKKGQSAAEYVVLATIIIAAVFVGGIYFKRGIQGRLREAVDGLGDQYDPELMNGTVTYTTTGNATTYVESIDDNINGVEGQWTMRLDSSDMSQDVAGSVSLIP
jgi:hypothetical protein